MADNAKEVKVRIGLLAKTTAEWAETANANLVLKSGEMGIEYGSPNRFKIGDGNKTWAQLGYWDAGLASLGYIKTTRSGSGSQYNYSFTLKEEPNSNFSREIKYGSDSILLQAGTTGISAELNNLSLKFEKDYSRATLASSGLQVESLIIDPQSTTNYGVSGIRYDSGVYVDNNWESFSLNLNFPSYGGSHILATLTDLSNNYGNWRAKNGVWYYSNGYDSCDQLVGYQTAAVFSEQGIRCFNSIDNGFRIGQSYYYHSNSIGRDATINFPFLNGTTVLVDSDGLIKKEQGIRRLQLTGLEQDVYTVTIDQGGFVLNTDDVEITTYGNGFISFAQSGGSAKIYSMPARTGTLAIAEDLHDWTFTDVALSKTIDQDSYQALEIYAISDIGPYIRLDTDHTNRATLTNVGLEFGTYENEQLSDFSQYSKDGVHIQKWDDPNAIDRVTTLTTEALTFSINNNITIAQLNPDGLFFDHGGSADNCVELNRDYLSFDNGVISTKYRGDCIIHRGDDGDGNLITTTYHFPLLSEGTGTLMCKEDFGGWSVVEYAGNEDEDERSDYSLYSSVARTRLGNYSLSLWNANSSTSVKYGAGYIMHSANADESEDSWSTIYLPDKSGTLALLEDLEGLGGLGEHWQVYSNGQLQYTNSSSENRWVISIPGWINYVALVQNKGLSITSDDSSRRSGTTYSNEYISYLPPWDGVEGQQQQEVTLSFPEKSGTFALVEDLASSGGLPCPASTAEYERVPVIKRGTLGTTVDDMQYVTFTQGAGPSTFALRTDQGALRANCSDSILQNLATQQGTTERDQCVINYGYLTAQNYLKATSTGSDTPATTGKLVYRGYNGSLLANYDEDIDYYYTDMYSGEYYGKLVVNIDMLNQVTSGFLKGGQNYFYTVDRELGFGYEEDGSIPVLGLGCDSSAYIRVGYDADSGYAEYRFPYVPYYDYDLDEQYNNGTYTLATTNMFNVSPKRLATSGNKVQLKAGHKYYITSTGCQIKDAAGNTHTEFTNTIKEGIIVCGNAGEIAGNNSIGDTNSFRGFIISLSGLSTTTRNTALSEDYYIQNTNSNNEVAWVYVEGPNASELMIL